VRLIQLAVNRGRAIVIVLNKMDCIVGKDGQEALRTAVETLLANTLDEIHGVEVIKLSAMEWRDGHIQSASLYDAVQRARQRWERRVPTSALTRFAARFNESNAIGMRRAKIHRPAVKFIAQERVRPPAFRMDGSSAVSDTYLKSLVNALREEFGFQGVPIRIRRPRGRP
jgi:GTP-binding protein